MATQSTKLTQQDLQIYPSERLTDNADGGGFMLSKPLTGADNELFAPISDVDRTIGSFDARLVYPAVLRDDTEPLYGAHVIISEPPKAQNVSFLAFAANQYGEQRGEILPRIEAYSVPTIESRLTLLGAQLKGSRMVQVYQNVDAPLPLVGERYAFREQNKEDAFVRIVRINDEVRTFEIAGNDKSQSFQKRVLKLEISDPLPRDFNGLDYPTIGNAVKSVRIFETQVADSARFFGVKKATADITQNTASVAVDGIYEKLVPTSTVETAHTDQYPVGSGLWLPTQGKVQYLSNASWYSKGEFYFGTSVLPGSVQLGDFKDNSEGLLVREGKTIAVDYQKGWIADNYSTYIDLYATPAVYFNNTNYTAIISIEQTNQGTEWAPLLKPKPARGSVSVSYMAMGIWHVLRDVGDGLLRDAKGVSRGRVENSGSLNISLSALPDVGSKMVIAYSPEDFYQTVDDKTPGSVIVPQNSAMGLSLLANPLPNIKPGTVRISATTASGVKELQDEHGAIQGDFSGSVDYASGTITINNATGVSAFNVALERYTAQSTIKTFTLNEDASKIYGTVGQVRAGAVMLAAEVEYVQTGGSQKMKTITHRFIGWLTASLEVKMPGVYEKIGQSQTKTLLIFTDNGQGGLLLNGATVAGASIDYSTGFFTIPKALLKAACSKPNPTQHQIDAHASEINIHNGFTVLNAEVKSAGRVFSKALADQHTTEVSLSVDTGLYQFNILKNKPLPRAALLNSWVFEMAGKTIIEQDGQLLMDFNHSTGKGTVVGALNPIDGTVNITHASMNISSIRIIRGILLRGMADIQQYYGRTIAAPIKPQSFTAYAKADETLVGRADENGQLVGELTGTIDVKTGFFEIKGASAFSPESLRYNVVTQSNIPLDSSIIGINAVRLPSDGRIPIFRVGDMIVIGHREAENLGSAFTAGQTIQLKKKDLDRVCLIDSQKTHINAELYSVDLALGTIKFANPLDLSAYTLPLFAHYAQEEENRVVGLDIEGNLKLQFPTKRAYPKEGTFISSALLGGDLQCRASVPFAQQAWNKVWADERQTDDVLSRMNVKDYPIALTSRGTITERWLIVFRSDQQFRLFGETLGLVLESDILTDLAPLNPSTNKPYFTIQRFAFGGGWAAGVCVRFNTYGTQIPTWILRAVQPSAVKQSEKDGFTACLRGNTIDQ